MKRKALFDRLATFALVLVLVGAILAAYQVGSRSGTSSASSGTLAAGTAVQSGTGYISVPAAAFVPNNYLVNYDNSGFYLQLNSWSSGDGFSAPLYLPHGATVTKLTLNYIDNDSGVGDYVGIQMYRNEKGIGQVVAEIQSDTDGNNSKSTTTITDPYAVDNSKYSYTL